MSHLLFAAARGARLEIRWFGERDWNRAYNLDLNEGSARSDCTYRIHPDDKHLQYGPISTALREFAVTAHYGGWPDGFVGMYGSFMCNVTDALAFTYCEDILHRSLFLLILAEALADSGL